MKNLGIALVVIGVVLLIIRGFNYTQKEEVVDLGKVEINKEETKTVSWPLYAGGISILVGIALIVADRRKT